MCLELDWGRFLMPNQVAVSNIVWISSSLARGWWLEVHVGEKSLVGLLQELMCRWLKAAITAVSSKVFWILVGKSLCTQCSYCGSCNITGEANVSLNCIHVGSVFQSNDINQVSTVAFWNYWKSCWIHDEHIKGTHCEYAHRMFVIIRGKNEWSPAKRL